MSIGMNVIAYIDLRNDVNGSAQSKEMKESWKKKFVDEDSVHLACSLSPSKKSFLDA